MPSFSRKNRETMHPLFPLQSQFWDGHLSQLPRGLVWACSTYPHRVEETMKNLYVGNMEQTTTEQDLRTAFGSYGPVEAVNIIMDRTTGAPRGFAFVEMTADKDAQEAILGLNGSLMAGRTITVGEARAKTSNVGTRNIQ